MEYGSATRQESSDKNAGFTGTATVEQQERQNAVHDRQGRTNLVQHLTAAVREIPPAYRLDVNQSELPQHGDVGNQMLTEGINALAGSIAGIADVAKEGWRKETTNKLALKASATQGTAIAINSVAETKKRNPFMAAVLGQTVTSRIAEAQSIENATTALYNRASENMPQLAELSTEDAIEVLAAESEDLVASIKDPMLRQQALDSLLTQMPKLAQAHHKERYALVRNKQVQNNREYIVNTRVAGEHGLTIASTPEERNAVTQDIARNVYKPNDPTGLQRDPQSIKEFRSLVHTQVALDLKNGNKTLYDAIRSMPEGHPDALTEVEKDGFLQAEGQYDSHRNTMAQQVVAEAQLMMLSAQSPEEAEAAAQIARQNLGMWGVEGTGSEIDVKNKTVVRARLEKMIESNSAAWAKNQVDLEHTTKLEGYHDLDDLAKATMYDDMSEDDKKLVSNLQIPQFMVQLTGMPIDQAKDAGLSVFRDGIKHKDTNGNTRHMSPVTFAQLFVREIADHSGTVPDVLQNFVDIGMQGMTGGKGEKGAPPTEAQTMSFRVLETLVTGVPGVKMSADKKVKFQIMRQGFGAGKNAETIEGEYQSYLDNKGKQDQSLIAVKERKQSVRSTVKKIMGGNVTDRLMSTLYSDYETVLQKVGFDPQIAKAVFIQDVLYNSSIVKGLKVNNGRILKEDLGTKYDLNTILNKMGNVEVHSKYGEVLSAASPVMMAIFGTDRDVDQELLTDTSRMQLTNVEYIPFDDSVEFKIVGGGVTRIPLDTLRNISELMEVNQKKEDFAKAYEKGVFFKSISALGYGGKGELLSEQGYEEEVRGRKFTPAEKGTLMKQVKALGYGGQAKARLKEMGYEERGPEKSDTWNVNKVLSFFD